MVTHDHVAYCGSYLKELQLIDITTRLAKSNPSTAAHMTAEGRAIHLITSRNRWPFHRYGTELSSMIKWGCLYAINDSHPHASLVSLSRLLSFFSFTEFLASNHCTGVALVMASETVSHGR
jgi:hypothetical protein